jgi:hypothetical protein
MVEASQSRFGLPMLLRRDLPGVISMLVFLGVTAGLFRSWEFALIVTASLGFHELGHALAITWFRLEYRIHFGFVGAWTWTRGEDRAGLSQLANVYIHLAGPLFSLGLALAALTLDALWKPDSHHLQLLANFSAHTGFLNLLPLGIMTDGGKALRRMAISAGAGKGRTAVLLLSGAAVIMPAAWVLFVFARQGAQFSDQLLGLLLIGAWLAAGVLAELRRSGPPVLEARRPMNLRQLAFVTLLIWDMLAVLFFVILSTPFWLAPQYVHGAIYNMAVVMSWIFGNF